MDGEMKIPRHVAIILDGNGRWAQRRGMPRTFGHVQGAKEVEKCLEYAWHMGIKYLTMYAFSTENWKRPPDEVKMLMSLLEEYMRTSLRRSMKNNIRIRVIGDKSGLSQSIRESILNLEDKTKENTGLNYQIAINYGGRDEIRRAVNRLLEARRLSGDTSEVTEEELSSFLDTAGIPDPDLMIRTGGEERISNFLLWQLAYTELYYTDKPWPDFSKEELQKALEAYQNRKRNFGGIVKNNVS